MALNALELKALAAQDRVYRKADEKGLYVEVFPNGSKLWRLKYRFNGQEKRLALGAYPDVSLAEAREKREAARRDLRNGIDPGHKRKMGKIAKQVGAGNTFASVAEDYIQTKLVASGRAEATIVKSRWLLDHLKPSIGSRPIAEIEPAELLAVLKRVEAKGKRETARRLRSFASTVFRFGVATTRCKTDPAALLMGSLAAPKVKHHAAILEPAQLGEFLRITYDYAGGPIVRMALRIAPHVFLRPGELRAASWEDVDWEEKVWRVRSATAKMRKPHAVPLSRQVIAMLRELEQHSGEFALMFPGTRSPTRSISENTINAAYRRMDFDNDVVTAHGLRSSASTLLNESGKWHPDAIERALAHGHSDATRGAYARGQHWDERVEMAQWWSDYLDELRTGSDAVPINRFATR